MTARARVLALVAKRPCVSCGYVFVPRPRTRRLCAKCHAGAAAILALKRARRLLRGLE